MLVRFERVGLSGTGNLRTKQEIDSFERLVGVWLCSQSSFEVRRYDLVIADAIFKGKPEISLQTQNVCKNYKNQKRCSLLLSIQRIATIIAN